jgi:hypothetical protein
MSCKQYKSLWNPLSREGHSSLGLENPVQICTGKECRLDEGPKINRLSHLLAKKGIRKGGALNTILP